MNRFADDPVLQELRGQLQGAEDLLQAGIFTEPASGRVCLAGRGDCTLRAEDLFFEAIAQIYLGWPADTIVNSVLALLDAQHASGRVPRALPAGPAEAGEHAWPFLSQTALLVHNAYGDVAWLTQEPYFSRLHCYLDYWLNAAPAELAYIDLACHLVRECRAFARLADMAGYQALATAYVRRAFDLTAQVRDASWDEQDGFFYDPLPCHEAGLDGRRTRWASGFAVLWAGVARTEQVKRLVFDYLFNAAEFWSPYPVAGASLRSMAGSERDRRTGGDPGAREPLVSVPVNYMLYHGLRNYGYRELASLLAHATHGLVEREGPQLSYNAESGAGQGGLAGRSLLACFLPFEEQCGAEIMNWRSKDPAREPGST